MCVCSLHQWMKEKNKRTDIEIKYSNPALLLLRVIQEKKKRVGWQQEQQWTRTLRLNQYKYADGLVQEGGGGGGGLTWSIVKTRNLWRARETRAEKEKERKKERRGRIFFHWINNGRLNPFRRRQTTYDYISIQLELRTVLYCTTRVSLFFPSFHYQLNQLNHRFLFPPFSFYIGYKINENLCILSVHRIIFISLAFF